MGIALLWVVLCLIPAAVARGKGRGGLSMFLVSLVLSPLIGLVWALAMRRQEEADAAAARRGSSRTHWLCPACAEPVRRNARVCRYCGRDLPAPPALGRDYSVAVAGVLAVGVVLWVGVGFFDSPKPAPARVSAVAQVGAGVADRKARWPAEGPAVLRKAEERLGAGDADGAVAF